MEVEDKIVRDAYMMRFELIKQRYPYLEIPSRDQNFTREEYKEIYVDLLDRIKKELVTNKDNNF